MILDTVSGYSGSRLFRLVNSDVFIYTLTGPNIGGSYKISLISHDGVIYFFLKADIIAEHNKQTKLKVKITK